MDKHQSCKNCKFWSQRYVSGGDPEEIGQCVRNAPTALSQPIFELSPPPERYYCPDYCVAMWPQTTEHMICGEWVGA